VDRARFFFLMEVHMSKWARAANRRGRKPGDFKMIQGVTRGGTPMEHFDAWVRAGRPMHDPGSPLAVTVSEPLNEPSVPRTIPQLVADIKEELKAQPEERVDWATAAALMRAGEIMKCNDGYFCKMVGDDLYTKPANWNPETSWNGPMPHVVWKCSTFEVVS
jgi:hypothetical protein